MSPCPIIPISVYHWHKERNKYDVKYMFGLAVSL